MKILTKEEENELVPLDRAGKSSNIRRSAFALNVGDTLFLSDKEWKSYKYAKSTALGSIVYSPTMKFSVRRHSFRKDTGWAIKRKK